ncbi:MAG: amidohydrolase family protein [Caulobacteraceae bacterium]
MRDLIIRGGTIVDGTGEAPFVGDIAIDGDRIVEVGEVAGPARREIDATGMIVTPGFVDIHTHYDGQATWDPLLAPSSWHGVTTAVMGNCGVGFAPVRPQDHQFLIELMEGVEDIPGSALAEGIEWKWERFPEYLDALEAMPRAIDVGVQVPHAPVRAYVLGDRCNTDYVPNADEIAEMAALVREGVEAGALGFSTSRTLLHKDLKGVYMPGTFAGSDEMLALGMAMKGLSHGVYELVSDHLGDDDEWEWVKTFAKESGLPVTLVATLGRRLRRQQDVQHRRGIPARRHGDPAADRRAPDRHPARPHLQLPHVRHPPDLAEGACQPDAGREGRGDAAAGSARGAARRAQHHPEWPVRRRSERIPLPRVPAGRAAQLRARSLRQRRRPGRGGGRDADGDDVRPADPRRRGASCSTSRSAATSPTTSTSSARTCSTPTCFSAFPTAAPIAA